MPTRTLLNSTMQTRRGTKSQVGSPAIPLGDKKYVNTVGITSGFTVLATWSFTRVLAHYKSYE
jgi:hypothetical protein